MQLSSNVPSSPSPRPPEKNLIKEYLVVVVLLAYLAVEEVGHPAAEVARSLAISRVNAGRCAERGKKVLENYEDLKDIAP